MLKLPENEVSLWRETAPSVSFPALNKDIEAEIVVVGAGICGLTAAYFLSQAGKSVAVLEKDTIGSGTTGHTTGKVTAQHGLIYNDLNSRFGEKTAKLYGLTNQKAIGDIKNIISKEKIDCGWRDDDNYVFTTDKRKLSDFEAESKIAQILGLPATFEKTIPLPFEVVGAVKFSGQGMFNAQSYIQGLAAAISKKSNKNFIFEKSRASNIHDGNPCKVNSNGHTITAKSIIVATNVPTFPLLARGSYCTVEYPHSSYIIAGEYKNKLKGMYISPDNDQYSILPVKNGSKQLLYIGGANHIPGLRRASSRYKRLAEYAQEVFGLQSIDYKWHARDYIAYDGLPLVGKIYPWSKNLYTATAFKKWGLTQTYVAASVLRDQILGHKNELSDIYTPHRTSPIKSIPRVAAKELGLN